MKQETRYRIECAKDNTPSTNGFLLWVPLFLFFAWVCRNDLPQVPVQEHHAIELFGWGLL